MILEGGLNDRDKNPRMTLLFFLNLGSEIHAPGMISVEQDSRLPLFDYVLFVSSDLEYWVQSM